MGEKPSGQGGNLLNILVKDSGVEDDVKTKPSRSFTLTILSWAEAAKKTETKIIDAINLIIGFSEWIGHAKITFS